MYTKFLWVFLLLPLQVLATGWTGIAAFVGQSDSDWLQASTVKQANIDFYGLRVEENTEVDLRVGARAGQFDLRLTDASNVDGAEKFTGQFISLYLRWPIRLSETLQFHSGVNYQINMGTKQIDTVETDINWTEIGVDLGLSLRVNRLSIRPFINFRSIDGDMTSVSQTRIFKQSRSDSQGIMLDYFVERSAYVRLQATTGSEQSIMLSFAREY